ncbi:A/G-specific adenine glycosylase [Nocardiopsis ansamitocini]|uniref:Adenine DNA glycosylase n=1 Tax=Nocardiopsis ansamitocini TaxID=1670832 RepID=A0A9W6UGF9_9ACTN|nr:A/G-specific adenine glycosylase [Nocardiopsis ansamitocini]GLU47386.1 adenine glycosylase [Nocardiopsis ansamitocini]
MNENPYRTTVLAWYERNARDLPWRTESATPWSILVSEIMLQQTPVVRVLPAWEAWMRRWPTAADLAAEPSGEAVRMWNRLGYPRRALNLHACATAIVERHGGNVPETHAELLALPGVGVYTSAAVASFAFGQRHAILDTNVRRVLARLETGIEYPPKAPAKAEFALAESLLPEEPAVAARWGVAVMELGALVCTARSPACGSCPVIADCAWVLAGKPPHDGPPRRGQTYAGTDRQVRGKLLAVLREAPGPVDKSALDVVWEDSVQRERALDALISDGLVDPLDSGEYALPG